MISFPINFFPNTPNFAFVNFRKISYSVTLVLLLLSFITILTAGFNFGIDFIGGISVEVRVAGTNPDLAKMRNVLNDLDIGEVSLQQFGSDKDLLIRVGNNNEANLSKNVDLIKESLTKNISNNLEYRKIDFVSPQVGIHMIKSGAMAMILSFTAIMLYIWLRFEWYFGLGVLLTLMHDVILSLGFMSFTGYDFNLSSVAAILTIIGYSVNDSVVIYDRIRENLRKYKKKKLNDLINLSINETLSRTTITVLTTLLANLALIIFGGEAIKSFSVLVFFGILAGTYSSIFISSPILIFFKQKLSGNK